MSESLLLSSLVTSTILTTYKTRHSAVIFLVGKLTLHPANIYMDVRMTSTITLDYYRGVYLSVILLQFK